MPTRTLGLWCYLSAGVAESATRERGKIPYPHRGEAMDTERDYAAHDGGKRPPSSFFFCCLALSTPQAKFQPALARATGRIDRRLVTPPRPLRQPLRQHNHDGPHLCAGLVNGVRSSLPLGLGSWGYWIYKEGGGEG
jgi:hypothetical protein